MKAIECGVRIPDFPDMKKAVSLYWSKNDIGTTDIQSLFGIGHDKAARIKRVAQKMQEEKKIPFRDMSKVSTVIAYEAWGFDISDLEKRLHRLQKLGVN